MLEQQHAGSGVTPERLLAEGWQEIADDDGFAGFTGPYWHRVENGQVTCGFFAEARHGNRMGFVHGGMIAALADRALGRTARLVDAGRWQVTIELSIQYIDSVRLGEFVWATGQLLRETSSVAFLNGLISTEDRLVANISGIWRIRTDKRIEPS